MSDESNDDRPFRAEDLKLVTIGAAPVDRVGELERRLGQLEPRVDELERHGMFLDPGWAPREPPKPAGPFRPSAYDVEVDLRMTLGQLARRVDELERLASGGVEDDEVARAFVDAKDDEVVQYGAFGLPDVKRSDLERARREGDSEVTAGLPAATRARRPSGDDETGRTFMQGVERAADEARADRGLRVRLELLVERWRGAAARLREKDRVSQRFERDIAEAYQTCADELFALLEEAR